MSVLYISVQLGFLLLFLSHTDNVVKKKLVLNIFVWLIWNLGWFAPSIKKNMGIASLT